MKSFLIKHRFKIVISILVAILIFVSFYMLWVHVPYANHENELTNIRQEIIAENDYTYDDYFNAYNSKETYYILKVKVKKKTQYVVYNEKQKFIKKYQGKIAKEATCIDAFKEKYKQEPTSIEIGYENDIFVYSLTYQGKDSLIYAFYGLDNGEFIKAYQL